MGASSRSEQDERIPFRMHPRVFAALGADLVTNDVVAVIELVKNAYDAMAKNVWVRFNTDSDQGGFLEIEDDGVGMTHDLIRDVWCLVATPFKEANPVVGRGRQTRRVAGEKGLGRLSAARLGQGLQFLTQAAGDDCWEVTVDWSNLAKGDDLTECYAICRKYGGASPFDKTGTRLRVLGLRAAWDDNRIADLEENLARLVSPFSKVGEFNILLTPPGAGESKGIKIESPAFLSKPKYLISGNVGRKGDITCTYKYASINGDKKRTAGSELKWEQIYDQILDKKRAPFSDKEAHCGPFTFEIRAWDIASDDAQEIAERFEFQKTRVRRTIRAHKGISVYRDDILVLPKSEAARDWLGLDLRRVSKVGSRMSTSQLVGYVAVTADGNPRIEDTSDRERLASGLELAEFEEILKTIVAVLENERDTDRAKPDREQPMKDLFENLRAEDLVAEVVALAKEDASAAEAVPLLRDFNVALESAKKTIQERFVFYSRMATVGTIAQMLVHEIRNRTTAFGSFLSFVNSRFGPIKGGDLEREYRCADDGVNALEQLADTFAPLASRSFRRRKRNCILEEQMHRCVDMHAGDMKRKGIVCHIPQSETAVAVDPGELDAVLLNLLTNAVYWLGQAPEKGRRIVLSMKPMTQGRRVRVWVDDSGPGLREADVEKVFWPGVTRKPDGIGMGLTVASELVAEYGGRMTTKHPGREGGASFGFDLPLKV